MLTRFVLIVAIAVTSRAEGQATPTVAAPAPTPPPTTKVEAFRPAAGTVMTFGYNELGQIGYSISVDARELRDARGLTARGVVVAVIESQYRTEQAFVDADELPELIRGVDALLAVKTNPTRYDNFEVQYTTRGELQIIAYGSGGKISYAVRVGRVTTVRSDVNEEGLRKLRAMFETANQLFSAQPSK